MKNDLDMIHSQYKDYMTDERNDLEFVKGNDKHLIADYQGDNLTAHMQVSQFAEGIMVSRILGSGDGAITANSTSFSHNLTVLINVSGIIHLTLESGKEIVIKPDEAWLIRGDWNNFHEKIISVNSEISLLYIYFSQEKTLEWLHEDLIPATLFTPDNFDIVQIIKISNTIGRIEYECHRLIHLPYECDGLSHLVLASAALNVLVGLFQNKAAHESHHKSKVDEIVDSAIDYIQAYYELKVTISMLAQAVGTNECYLKQVFKQRTGLTIANYIRQYRLEVAYEMLISGHTIQESMGSVGYNHIGNFSKIFKKQYGFTPKNLKL